MNPELYTINPLVWEKLKKDSQTAFEKHYRARPLPGIEFVVRSWANDPDDPEWQWYFTHEDHSAEVQFVTTEEEAKVACFKSWVSLLSGALTLRS